jgi:hypothetical protein
MSDDGDGILESDNIDAYKKVENDLRTTRRTVRREIDRLMEEIELISSAGITRETSKDEDIEVSARELDLHETFHKILKKDGPISKYRFESPNVEEMTNILKDIVNIINAAIA